MQHHSNSVLLLELVKLLGHCLVTGIAEFIVDELEEECCMPLNRKHGTVGLGFINIYHLEVKSSILY